MAQKVMALNDKGQLTYCTVPPEERGKGRCNHVDHQQSGEDINQFVVRINSNIKEEKDDKEVIVDQQQYINDIVSKYPTKFNQNPDWEDMIKNEIPNYFTIGKGEDYEEADIQKVDQISELDENGDPVVRLNAQIEFRGELYDVDLGSMPEVQEDGTIIMNGSKMRVLPVLNQTKSGLVRYKTKSVVKTDDGHVAFMHNPGEDYVTIKKDQVPLEEIEKYMKNDPNDPPNLTANQIKDLNRIDPIFYKRFPNAGTDIRDILNDHEPDEANDISWRKVNTYSDQVKYEMQSQMRRMGVTFRTNLNAKQKAEESGDKEQIEKADKLPLFYQKNMSTNVKSNLTGRSNVQIADNINPLAALSQSRKISLTGPGGYNKDKAPTMLRQVSDSHKDKIDSLDLSSGKNVGLTMTLGNADLDEDGFIKENQQNNASVSDFIPYKRHNDINRASMAVAHMKQAVPIAGGEDPKLSKDSSTGAWNEISGAKLGTNLNTAYYASAGTHEDAVVISESAARKMMTKQSDSYKINRPEELKGSKPGDKVTRGSYIGGTEIKYNGNIKSIEDGKIEVESEYKMGPGDKIAGRHGNKGVVSKVLPDNEMPKMDKGNGNYESTEILMSPMSVVGRMNIGQVYETNGGELNKKTKLQLNNGRKVDSTSGEQFIMRLNHIAEKKLQAHANETGSDREPTGLRLGEMESLIMSPTPERRTMLNYMRNQEGSDAKNKLDSLLKSIGVEYKTNN